MNHGVEHRFPSPRPAAVRLALGALLALSTSACSGNNGAAAPPGFEEAARAFYLGMASEDPAENRTAMAAWVPTQEDLEWLFPGHGALLWKTWGPEATRLIADAPAQSESYRSALPYEGVVRTSNLRENGSVILKRSIEFMRPDVPVYGGMVRTSAGDRVASSVVKARERWVWIWQLERAGGLISPPDSGA